MTDPRELDKKAALRMDGFGERLKRLRKERNITQGQLAETLGVVASAVGKYERQPNA